jgi:hypothetical protein
MSVIRSWIVRSNSFEEDYAIFGETLEQALTASLSAICADALPRHGHWKATRARGEWRADILNGRGGVELVIEAAEGAVSGRSSYPVWINAASADLRTDFEWVSGRSQIEV